VRLEYDTSTEYSYPWLPKLFIDDFGTSDDDLVRLNTTGTNAFQTQVHIGLMSGSQRRFREEMQFRLDPGTGTDIQSEETLQVNDLFASKNPYLLGATILVSFLHVLFEILAFKSDVVFWQNTDPETLNRFLSVRSLFIEIVMKVVCALYLVEHSANILVVGATWISIFVDVWKVNRAMKLSWFRCYGVAIPTLTPKFPSSRGGQFDITAMRWLALLITPLIVLYAVYSLVYDCHRGLYSYLLTVSASCVYSFGFILMTPQIFINYKLKTVAHLPWRKFVYRALTTFIDDLFAFVVKMPTMHRLSCFRDDVVFFIYLAQLYYYPVDSARSLDDGPMPMPENGPESSTSRGHQDRSGRHAHQS